MKANLASFPIPHGSLSTILGASFSGKHVTKKSSPRFDVTLSDGSVLSGEVDLPDCATAKANVLLVHGLGSSCHDPAVVRQARFLAERGFKVYRLNHRNVGSGKGKASGFYHGFRGADLHEAIAFLKKSDTQQKWILIGQSLSGNMVMKIAGGKESSEILRQLGCIGVAAVSPVIDLRSSSLNMHRPMFGVFNKLFLRKINSYLSRLGEMEEELLSAARRAKKLSQFDENFLAPALGLSSADDYYERASCRDVLDNIFLPTEVFLAKDDPIAPGTFEILRKTKNSFVKLNIFRFGGHLGFLEFDLLKRSFTFPIDRHLFEACERFVSAGGLTQK
ncbi:MAG: hypothetical protein RL189_1377 [Pseudomonadota bacterium]|jgi:predicted alpha/beta-fold hydrolase